MRKNRRGAMLGVVVCVAIGGLLVSSPMAGSLRAAPAPVFHLDFSQEADISGNKMDLDFEDAVSLDPGGGPTLSNGRTLDAARWEGFDDDTNQIIIFDNPILDDVAVGAGSITSWIKVDDESEWNNIAKTVCPDHAEPCDAFGQYLGIEFQTNEASGVFGAVQGWDTNNFGPAHASNGGFGGTETPTDEWTHAALTWNELGDHTIFVNGEPGMTVEGVGGAEPFGQNDPEDWTIGGDGCCQGDRRLSGELADFAIFDVELSEQDIAEIIATGVPSSAGTPLQAGDSDMDCDFDQIDLVQVQVAAKYLTGEPATWGEGDWNGAPGGSVENKTPPPGNGQFDQLDIIAALGAGKYLQGSYCAEAGFAAHAIPEPSTFVLLAFGVVSMLLSCCRHR